MGKEDKSCTCPGVRSVRCDIANDTNEQEHGQVEKEIERIEFLHFLYFLSSCVSN